MQRDNITLAEFDYYGTTLAVYTNKGEIKIFTVMKGNDDNELLASYATTHHGIVTGLHWGHPRFSPKLLSSGTEGKIYLYSTDPHTGAWTNPQVLHSFEDAVLDAKFAPEKLGLIIGCVTSQQLKFLAFDELQQGWNVFEARDFSKLPLVCLSWASLESAIVVGGVDGNLYILHIDVTMKQIKLVISLKKHIGAITSLSWPFSNLILSSCDSGEVMSWTKDSEKLSWAAVPITKFTSKGNITLQANGTGNLVIITDGGMGRLFKQTGRKWKEVQPL